MSIKNTSEDLHEAYRALHKKASGRETRPKETFDVQFRKVLAGEAFLVVCRNKGKVVGCSYFEYANGVSLYASGADDPEFTNFPLYHLMIYAAMIELNKLGVKQLSVGQPANPSAQFDYYPDDKQLQIAKFKRGFGGNFATTFRGIKYYSQSAFDTDVAAFKVNYLKK